MEGNRVPGGLEDVAGPLKEAAQYEIVALERRRGILGLVAAVLMALIVLAKGLGWSIIGGDRLDLMLLALFLIASYGVRTVLQKRPGWAPVFAQPTGRRFVKQYVISIGVAVVFIVVAANILHPLAPPAVFWSALTAASMGVVGVIFVWLAPRTTPNRYFLLGGWLAAFLLAARVVSPDWSVEVTIGAMTLAALLESSYRLLAPRGWLVR